MEPADAGSDDHGAATRVGSQLARVTERVGGGAEAELGDPVLTARLLGPEVLDRIEVADLTGERNRQVGGIEARALLCNVLRQGAAATFVAIGDPLGWQPAATI